MNDTQLLELAAKACGMPRPVDDNGVWSAWVGTLENGHWWEPLDDDGDALRIAAYLRLEIIPGKHAGDGCSINSRRHEIPGVTVFRDSKDMAEQMRRAIVMAAAEIGKIMP